jgi:hypothetical protein
MQPGKSNQIKTSGLSSLQAASNKSLRWTKSTEHMLRLKLLRQRIYTGTMKRYCIMYCKCDCCFVVQLELSMVSVRHVFEATAYMLRKAKGIFISCLLVCWLEVIVNRSGSAICHLDTIFLGFPLSSRKCWNGFQFPSFDCMLLM